MDYQLGDTMEIVNYWAVVHGQQIIEAKTRKRGGKNVAGVHRLFLWCKLDESEYDLSEAGVAFRTTLPRFLGSSYVADVTYRQVPGRDLGFWKDLYDEGLFPFWDPEGGPYRLMESADPSSQYVAVYRVFRMEGICIGESDVRRERAGAKLVDATKLLSVKTAQKDELLPLAKYQARFDHIKELRSRHRIIIYR